jgi:alpha-L-fucosidase 2
MVDEAWDGGELLTATVHSTIGGTLRLRSYIPLQLAKGAKGVVLREAQGACPNLLLAPANIKQPLQSKELKSLSLLPIRKVYEYDLETTPGEKYYLKGKK